MTTAALIIAALVPAQETAETASIQAVIRALNHARQRNDIQAAASLFGPDADVWVNGSRIARGPGAVEKLFVKCRPWSEETRPWIRNESVRLLGPDVALVDAVETRYGSVIVTSAVPVTIVLQKQQAAWRIVSFRVA